MTGNYKSSQMFLNWTTCNLHWFAVGKIDMVIGQILTTAVEPMSNELSTKIVSSVRIALIVHWSLVPCWLGCKSVIFSWQEQFSFFTFQGLFRCWEMGTGASSGASQTESCPNIKERSSSIEQETRTASRKTSSISKRYSNGFITLSYEPTHTPLVRKRGCIKEGFPLHGLIQDKYFLIKDHFDGIDKLNTLETHGAPNFRKSRGPYPVYGMGQPSRDGLAHIIQTVVENGHKVRDLSENEYGNLSAHCRNI